MAKLYATIENSKGKTVSLSDNEILTATVYDGNMKAYSVIIEWCSIGDPEHLHCKHCDWSGDYSDTSDDITCPECNKGILETIYGTMGAIVTTREWRNRPETNDKANSTGAK